MSEAHHREPTFAEVLEELRTSRGLNQAQLAKALGVYDGNVARWRHGGGIEIENVRKIADYFGVDRAHLERLAGYGDNEPAIAKEMEPTIDPAIAALYDAELAETHAELRGVPSVFHRAILEARRTARNLAIQNAWAALQISQAESQELAPPAQPPAKRERRSGGRPRGPLSAAYAFAG